LIFKREAPQKRETPGICPVCPVVYPALPVARKLLGAPFSLVLSAQARRFFNGGDAGHGVVGSSKLPRALKLTVLVRGFVSESARSAAPA